MKNKLKNKFTSFALVISISTLASSAFALTDKEQLGKMLYFDTNLSQPAGQACASCHTPEAGFADPDTNLPVSEGVIPGRFGGRNSPAAAYASFSPVFSYSGNTAVGGQFWDGRAADLVEQAKGPFLNPVEMNNPDMASVVTKVQASAYSALFQQVYGVDAFASVELAYHNIADAIASYEGSTEVNQLSSKYDFAQAGQASLTQLERRGEKLFNGRGKCSKCHATNTNTGGAKRANTPELFTDFTYHNLGLPKNTEFPLQDNPVDYGLGAILGIARENGKFKTPHLRNIALTPPYMHNGLLKTLKEVVHFYNTRDIPGLWAAPEVPENVETALVGNLGLTDAEEDAIVAFMMTLTDGYTPAP